MKTLTMFSLAAMALTMAACGPKKDPAPKVTAETHATVDAAAEGTAAAAALPARKESAGVAKDSLPVLGPAPSWKLKDVNGAEVSSADFKGKVLVVDFWATWCPPCRAEIPGYVELAKKYKDRVAIVGVSVDEGGVGVVKDFVKRFNVSYPIVMAEAAAISGFGDMDAIPTTFLIDRNGNIRDKKVGAVPSEEYEKRIQSLLD